LAPVLARSGLGWEIFSAPCWFDAAESLRRKPPLDLPLMRFARWRK
jgi:hypothetical protein